MPIADTLIEREIVAALARRDPESSVCPSEVARLLMPASCNLWRTLMPRVRDAAAKLAKAERVAITRGKRWWRPTISVVVRYAYAGEDVLGHEASRAFKAWKAHLF